MYREREEETQPVPLYVEYPPESFEQLPHTAEDEKEDDPPRVIIIDI